MTHHETRPLSDLSPHPQQHALYSPLPPDALAALAADIDRSGLRHAVEITHDGTVIDGHQRVQA